MQKKTEEIAVIEQEAKQEGRTLVMVLAPKNTKSKKGTQPKNPKSTSEKEGRKGQENQENPILKESSDEKAISN